MVRLEKSLSVVFALAFAAAGCSTAPPAPQSSTRATPESARVPALNGQLLSACEISGEVPVKASVPGFCGTLSVPEDRSNPSGRQIGLRVAVVPAQSATPAADPFFAIAGGPSEASSQFFAWLPGVFSGVHASHDIVLVDQRGTGDSNPLTVPEMPDTSGMSAAQADSALTAWAKDGVAVMDGDPRFYTSTVAADDLDAVRTALGYDRINLYGTSYGATLAQYYLRQYPDHVRVAVLDGATPLDVPVLEKLAANSQHALDLLLQRCAADASCNAMFPELASEWSTLQANLARGVTTNVVDPTTGQPATVDLVFAGRGLHAALLTEGSAAKIPLAIHLSFEGKWDQLPADMPSGSPPSGPTSAMADEIFCSESWARFDPTQVQANGADSYALPVQLAAAQARATMCRYLPKGVIPDNDGAAVETQAPILWLTADGDPQDPPVNLAFVMTQDPNSTIAVMPAQEHVVGHIGCAPDVIAAFVDAGTGNGLDISCITQRADPSPTFHLQ